MPGPVGKAALMIPWIMTLASSGFGQPPASNPNGTDAPKAPVVIAKETTYVVGPRDDAGRLDFIAALNDLASSGVSPQDNANVQLWQAFGPAIGSWRPAADYFQRLGVAPPHSVGPNNGARDDRVVEFTFP